MLTFLASSSENREIMKTPREPLEAKGKAEKLEAPEDAGCHDWPLKWMTLKRRTWIGQTTLALGRGSPHPENCHPPEILSIQY